MEYCRTNRYELTNILFLFLSNKKIYIYNDEIILHYR